MSAVIGQAQGRLIPSAPRSMAVNTPCTPGSCLAVSVLILVILAWASGLRTTTMCTIPGSMMLSVQRVRPVISRASSLRLRARPSSPVAGCAVAVISSPLQRRCRAAVRTARSTLAQRYAFSGRAHLLRGIEHGTHDVLVVSTMC